MDTMILLELTPPDKAKVTNTSPDDSDPLKLGDVNCISNTIVTIIQILGHILKYSHIL